MDTTNTETIAPVAPVARKAKPETKARTLRPRQIRELYGIPQSTLHHYCTSTGPDRLPSIKLPGRKGNKGSRLVRVDELEAWLARHQDA